ncbi:IS66-like element ISBthe5 family transposase [soil metagenome]
MIATPDLLLEVEKLRSENQKQQSELQQKDLRITKLEHQLNQLLRHIYGQKSEKFTVDPQQIKLGLDLPVVSTPEKKKETITYERTRPSSESNHKGRLALPEHLPRVDQIIPPLEDVTGLKKIGEEITERLECDPGKLFVTRFIRYKYAKENNDGVIIADLPSSPIEKGRAGASILALIIVQKYVDHLPLYRQIEQFKRMGITIPSSTMSDWIKMAAALIAPLYEALVKKILQSNYLQVDETRIQVLERDEKSRPNNLSGRAKTHRGWYWVYRDPQSGLVLFDYHESRAGTAPKSTLRDFKGYLQSDGYEVYNQFDKNNITLLHCMAHARRYFEQALDNDHELASHALKEIQKLYQVEKLCRDNNLSHSERLIMRKEKSVPVLNTMHQWLKETIDKTTHSEAIGKAIRYSLPRWEKLMIYTTDGKPEIDNNLVENSIRPIAIGRKNYLFAGSHASAQNAAMFYSLLGTCKLKGIEPFSWLKNIFEVLPDYKANRLEELLP